MTDLPTLDQSGEDRRRAAELSLEHRRPPARLPGYEPERFLGAGAYGEVWVAVDRNTRRRVAIKFYAHRGGLDWSLLSREVEKLSFLFADRYVVQLLDVGWDAEPPYYVMEYLEHGSLEDRLAAGPLPVPQAVSLFREVAVGLVHAHGKGVLHCDLKPANILLDQDGKPRLADFGQSRLSHEQSPALGTLFYMAPEQADLEAVPDARWDVYALGAVLYRMLTGQTPHRTEEATKGIEEAQDIETRLARYRQLIKTAPSPRAHYAVRAVDRALAEIVDRCLAPSASRRYPNAQAVLDALDARTLRHARRPLLILGAVGPALLLIVMTLFAWTSFGTAVSNSDTLVTEGVLESNRFAAEFVADAVAREIDLRWQVLGQVAAGPGFQQALEEATGQPRDHPQRKRLGELLEKPHARYRGLAAASCFVTDRSGIQLARWPKGEKTIDQDYSYRDYFHGQGKDLPPGTTGIQPITEPHRSIVFTSQATHNRIVAFSVPVWSIQSEVTERSVIGVLAMTVELGRFAELRPETSSEGDQIAVLVDNRPDWRGRRGLILEHPRLARLLESAASENSLPYLDDALNRRIEEMRVLKLDLRKAAGQAHTSAEAQGTTDKPAADSIRQLRQLGKLPDYTDPVGGEYQGRWLAAIEPVIVGGSSRGVQDVGWAVLVQRRYDTATYPVRALRDRLVRQGLIALGVVTAVVTGLWGAVILVLNESPRSRLFALVKRQAGLPSEGGSAPRSPDRT